MERKPMKISYPVLLSSSSLPPTFVMYSPRLLQGQQTFPVQEPIMSMATVMGGQT